MHRISKSKLPVFVLVFVISIACLGACGLLQADAAEAEAQYKVYPTPHQIDYKSGEITLRNQATVVTDSGIDGDTKARLKEVLALKGITGQEAQEVPASNHETVFMVGINGSKGPVDTYAKKLAEEGKVSVKDNLFEKTDAYYAAVVPADKTHPDIVLVLGKDTDSAFYGLTTLYQIFQQLPGAKLKALSVNDWADVVTRGFIEGYYGDPWSTKDRENLMRWGGYYKLNAYVYAPKDDPKHNAQWRSLYSEDELVNKIEPLAKAGNESKCRFLYALHPFMNAPITSNNYDESVAILKKKFEQVMDHGVRQICILADDAANQGPELYTKLLKDMTSWLQEKQKATNPDGTLKYPGLKDTLVFCPVNYTSWGEGWYANLPKNVQVMNTGGRIWGKIDNNFASSYKRNSGGRSPFMWINWPCSDNDKTALHMGGHDEFLGSDLQEGTVDGIVLNPMQQSEPSKHGIFMNADLCWNFWKSTDHSAQAWKDSWSYVDHNSPVPTKGSEALRVLSGHMKRMYGGGATWINNESSDIKPQLEAFKAKLNANSVTAKDCDDMIAIFKNLQNTAATYRANAGNAAMLKQIKPWIDTWQDLTDSAILDLNALKASLTNDASNLLTNHSKATQALENADGHGFHYVNHTEYARVGKAYITPFVTALNKYVSDKATLVADPNAIVRNFITNRQDEPSNSTDVLFDGKMATGLSYKSPAAVSKGTYIGFTQNKPFDLTSFTITYDPAHPNDTLRNAQLQVQRREGDDSSWEDVAGKSVSNNRQTTVRFDDMNEEKIYGVRFIATQDQGDCWLTINEIEINTAAPAVEAPKIVGTPSLDKQVVAWGSLGSISDGNSSSETMLKKGSQPGPDTTVAGASITVTFDEPKTINRIVFEQGATNPGDTINKGRVSYQAEDGSWHEVGTVSSAKKQVVKLATPVKAKAIKVENSENKAIWWRVDELHALYVEPSEADIVTTASLSEHMGHYQNYNVNNVIDGEDSTLLWARGTGPGNNIDVNDAVTLTFSQPKTVGKVRIVQGKKPNGQIGDMLQKGVVEVKPAGENKWVEVGVVNATSVQTVSFENMELDALRVRATEATNGWWVVNEITPLLGDESNGGEVITNMDGASLTAKLGDGNLKVNNGTAHFKADGDYVAFDLGKIRSGVVVDKGQTTLPDNVKIIHSFNGLEWHDYDGTPVKARYIGLKASSAADVNLKGMQVTYTIFQPVRCISSNLGNFDASRIFDDDLKTTFKNTQGAYAGAKVVFDLGRERDIHSIAYYIPETSLDFIRNAVIEVADSPNAPDSQWKEVLKINGSTIVPDGEGSDLVAKNAPWLTHDSTHPGFMLTANPKNDITRGNEQDPNGTAPINVKGRYLRIRFLGTYTYRWVEIGEILINNGEYVSPYVGGAVDQSNPEAPHHTPDKLYDGDVATTWKSSTSTGNMTYRIDEPLTKDKTPKQGVRFVSDGKPSGAVVKAVVYTDDTYTNTAEIELGKLNQPISEFRFVEAMRRTRRSTSTFAGVRELKLEWDGNTPEIGEVFLLDDAAAADKKALQELVDRVGNTDTSTWTKSTADNFANSLANAREALDNRHATQNYVDGAKANLDSAFASQVPRYTAPDLQNEVNKAITNGKDIYSPATYQAYEDALNDARNALADPENLSQADGERYLAALTEATHNLEYSPVFKDRAAQLLNDVRDRFVDGDYTKASLDAYNNALANLEKKLQENTEPAELKKASDDLVDAQKNLVDVSGLTQARNEYTNTRPDAYSTGSFAAYTAAYRASDDAHDHGTPQSVAAAVEALNNARKALEPHNLAALIEEAKALKASDYTKDSFAPIEAVLAQAEANQEPANEPALADTLATALKNRIPVTALTDTIKRAQNINRDRYTPESLAALDKAVADAQPLYVNGTPESINAGQVAILNAIVDLKLKDDTPIVPVEPVDPVKPVEPTEPTDNTSGDTDADKTEKPATQDNTSTDAKHTEPKAKSAKHVEVPKTGDEFGMAPMLGLFVAGLALVVVKKFAVKK